ncbi:hypothetical protein KAFR_0C06520 [Kazachstania africana CBS 2517]|uniref:Eukaryotic translation initiation factor 3 subunit C n=1 Tax=Kazachstania africana (strain ATCC 22294 / BCRC 22015 / CBS 2517 / CECT 1963 / NBRC 1671 / NRRL Y-8276) TaxID=1071382 RepID=H2ATE8_KAZAF|nr:hypothetical protein KAFR_0C06520 [Kazachstania africana CBS 2517]CCF57648.1 hypothetical protein KAFR_0C06520 [Kazachstania africana CBS 2517]
MSRFFADTYEYDSATSSSEEDLLSSSEEELLSSSSGEEDNQSDDSLFNESESESDFDSDDSDSKPYGPDWFKKSAFRKGGSSTANKFLKGNADYSSSDESDAEGKRVVKSAKDKLLDEMTAVFDKIETAEMSEDWVTILNEFDLISRLLIRAQQQNMGIPRIFIKVVGQVEDLVGSTDQSEIKNKAVARAYNTVRQRVKKVARENEELMAKLKEDPEFFDKEATVDLESSVADMEATPFGANKAKTLASLATATSETSFFTALRIVIDSRGKKNTNQQDLIKILEESLSIAKTSYESIMAYLTLIPTRFDASSNLSYQPIEQWKASYNDIMALFSILDKNIDTYQVTELALPSESIEDEPEADQNGIKKILGSIFSFVERLDDEFNKSLLNIDPHSSDYLVRLRDEQSIYNLILRTQLYLEAILPEEQKERLLSRVFVKRLDHIYYKSERLNTFIETNAWKTIPSNYKSKYIAHDGPVDNDYIKRLVFTISDVLTKQEDSFLRTRAILYRVYFTALNDDFHTAKEMLLHSNIQADISKSNSSLQILFNRVVVQLGLSAFQSCLIEECHQVLNELLASTHLKEILGQQNLQRVSSTIDEREQQCLPYHQHINLDLIDVIFMTCSLIIEIPQMAAYYSGIKVKRLPYSQKSIRRLLEHHDKSTFQGPPETSRDFVMYAAKSMQKGEWEKSVKYLQNIKAWKFLPNASTVMDSLTERIQIESLKSYFFTYKRFYCKFSTSTLSTVFDLPTDKIVEVLQSVIDEFEIPAKFDENKAILIVEKGEEITKLEEVALRLNKEYKINKERLYAPHRS